MSSLMRGFIAKFGGDLDAAAAYVGSALPDRKNPASEPSPVADRRIVRERAIAALSVGHSAAAQAQTSRIEAIIRSEEACGREQFAQYLALETSLTVDEAIERLCARPRLERDGHFLDAFLPPPAPAKQADAAPRGFEAEMAHKRDQFMRGR